MTATKKGDLVNRPKNKNLYLKPNNTMKRLPHQLLKQVLSRAYSIWYMYVDGYQFFINRRDKQIDFAKGYCKLIREYERRVDSVIKESERCDCEASEYLKWMKQARSEIEQLENQGGYNGK